MATKKAAGSAKNLRDSNPKYLGTKLHDGQVAQIGSIIVRQRGSVILAGKNVRMGRDHTLYSVANGVIKFGTKRKTSYNNQVVRKTVVSVVAK
jgi:large subunit ribosomal protein L27